MCFSNCASVLYGYKKVTSVDKTWSNELATKFDINSQHLLFLDSLETANLVKLVCNSNKSVQPMQFHYVVGDSIVSSYFNCYAIGNMRNLHWSFEDINHSLVDGDCVFSDIGLNKQLRDLVSIKLGDLSIVVFSSMFKRQSEDLLKTVSSRSKESTLFLVNIDAYYASIFNK
jgi:hypothetical protein